MRQINEKRKQEPSELLTILRVDELKLIILSEMEILISFVFPAKSESVDYFNYLFD